MLPYLYIIKTKFLVALAYRFQLFSSIVGQLLMLAATICFWIAAYGSRGVVGDTSMRQMIDYTMLSLLLGIFYSTTIEDQIRQSIRKGNVAVDFIKPVSLMGMYFATDVAVIISNLLLKFVPVFIIGSLVFGIPIPQSPLALLAFIIMILLGFMILWLINAIFGLFSFWIIELGPIGSAKSYIIRFISGGMIPLWFLPAWLSNSMEFLPFMYIYQGPISVYIGKMSLQESFTAMGIQVVWIAILYVCMQALKRKAFGNVIVQGG